MRKISTALLLGGLFATSLFSQSLTFTRTYGNGHYDDARGIVATADGGFAFTGLNKSDADADGAMYLTKVNAAGAVLWTERYLRPEEDGGNHLLPTRDGGFLITGHTALSYGVLCDGFVVKTDAEGKEEWRSFVGGVYDDVCDAALELPDGSFLVAGRGEENASSGFRMLLARLNPLGVVQSQRLIPASRPSVAYAMAMATDGNVLLAGYSYGKTGERDNMLLVKCTPDGDVLWTREWGSELHQRANAVVPIADGGCFVAGGANDESGRYRHMSVSRFSSTGEMLAASTVMADDGAGYLYAATAAPAGRLAVAGVWRPNRDAHALPFYALLDDDLTPLNWQTVKLPVECRTRCIATNPAGGFVLAGNEFLGNGRADIFLATLAEQGATLSAKDVAATANLLFPNPFHEVTYLKTGAPGVAKTLLLSTVDGRVVRRVTFEENEYLLERGDLPAGMYMLRVRLNNGVPLFSGKLWVE